VLIGVRINARRPRRARLVTANTLITTVVLAAVLMALAQDHHGVSLGYQDAGQCSALQDSVDKRTNHQAFQPVDQSDAEVGALIQAPSLGVRQRSPSGRG
jgi:hypothetical protein